MNEARREIFELISNAEKKAGVSSGTLARIYEWEESVVHQRERDMTAISKIIDSMGNT